jgi:hypothetical protein
MLFAEDLENCLAIHVVNISEKFTSPLDFPGCGCRESVNLCHERDRLADGAPQRPDYCLAVFADADPARQAQEGFGGIAVLPHAAHHYSIISPAISGNVLQEK